MQHVHMHTHTQVAFGSDFSEEWDDESLGLKWAKGNGKLTFLIAHTFKGAQKRFNKGFLFQVRNLKRVLQLHNYIHLI